jgi:hypothetical protein
MNIGKKSSLQPMIHSSSSRWHLLVMSQSLQLSKTWILQFLSCSILSISVHLIKLGFSLGPS